MQSAPNELDRLMGERVRHAQDYQRVLAGRDDEIDRLRHSIGPGSERWRSLIDRRNRASAEYEALAGQIGRPVNRLAMSSLLFAVLAIGLAVVETPVNKFLFDVALQSSNVASSAVSFAVAVFLLIAHISPASCRARCGANTSASCTSPTSSSRRLSWRC